ncbi:hypothetical protein Tsubulata_026704, partial [Turnera subulata]
MRARVTPKSKAKVSESKLSLLEELGISPTDIVKIITCRLRFLSCRIHNCFEERPAVLSYERMSVSGENLVPMLLSRPTLIPRTTFDYEKLEYIRKIWVTKDSKMYKHIVTALLKPRALLAGKIEDMGLSPKIKGPLLLRAMRMREKRFVKIQERRCVKDFHSEAWL